MLKRSLKGGDSVEDSQRSYLVLNRRGQLTLFVIFGVLIVIGIIALFLLLPKPEISRITSSKDPLQDIRPCISKSLEDVLPEYFNKGLYFNHSNSLIYSGEVVAYHCYTSSKKSICLRNGAQGAERIQKELKNKISSEVEQCFTTFKENNRAYSIEMGQTDLSLEILPGKIIIKTRKDFVVSKSGEEPTSYNNFDVSVNSPMFDFIRLSNEILNEEVSCNCPYESCTADTAQLMRNNKDYKITVYIGGRDEKVYTIEDYYEQNKLNFAVKNCDKTP